MPVERWGVGAAALLSALSALVGAQEPVAVKPRHPPVDSILADSSAWVRQDTTRRGPNCWRPQRRPPCDSYFLTEIGVEAPIASRAIGERVTWTLGVMGTRGGSSQGGAISFHVEPALDMYIPVALEWRYRRWLSDAASANAALGYKRTRLRLDDARIPANGLTAMVGVTANQWIGFTVRGELLRGGGRSARGLSVGVTSTRMSELVVREAAVGVLRAILARIGIRLGDDED